MIKIVLAAFVALCASSAVSMAAELPTANFLAAVRSIDVVMTRDPASPNRLRPKADFGGRERATPGKPGLEICTASQYGVGDGYHGRRAADGSIFNTYATNPYTVAHLTRRLGSFVTVTNLANGRAIRAEVTDRGPYYHGRCVDLGRAGADAIGMGGTARVRVE